MQEVNMHKRSYYLVQNYRGFLNYENQFLGNLHLLTFVGGSMKQENYTNINVSSYGSFIYPNFWSIDNGSNWPDYGSRGRVRGNNYGSKVVYSVMGSATLSWKSEYYLEVQGRNDWSSTLDPKNNSYFYPGIAFNWNFSNSLHIPYVNFGKLRVSWADVGRAAPGFYYAYQSYSTSVLNNTNATVINPPGTLFAGDIKPERKREFEIGFDGRLFKQNRVETSFSFYRNNVYDQIMGVDLSHVTGASSIKINAGNVANWGYEFFVKGAVFSTKKMRWELTYTAAVQKSKVKKLYTGITSKTIGSVGQSVTVTAAEGEPYGQIKMYDYLTDGHGNRVVDNNGYYVLDKSKKVPVGNISDRFFGGVGSDFFLSGFNFHIGLDYKFGGSIFSYSNYYLLGMGISKSSLKYRDEAHGGLAYYISNTSGERVLVDQGDPANAKDGRIYHDGVITPGVVRTGGTDENPEYAPNTTILSAAEYYSSYIHDMSQDFQPDNIYKNNYIKLRELSVSYTIPEKISKKMALQKLSVSFIARNLFYLYKSIPNIDAESTLGTNSFVEYSFFPSARTFGMGLNVSF